MNAHYTIAHVHQIAFQIRKREKKSIVGHTLIALRTILYSAHKQTSVENIHLNSSSCATPDTSLRSDLNFKIVAAVRSNLTRDFSSHTSCVDRAKTERNIR